jgi:repressor LexA
MADLDLTKRQQEIFDFIKKHSANHGYPPTVRDIGKAIGLTSSSTVHAHLSNLETGGLPLVGQVAAGQPLLAEENIEEYVQIPTLAGGDEGEYVLTVTGDSMINAGIHDGDHVVVRTEETAKDGEIVVALVGDSEATVKRFFKEEDHIRLQPENDALEPIRSAEVTVLGRVVGVLRRVS